MAKNLFMNLSTDRQDQIKRWVANRIGTKLYQYVCSLDYTRDCITNNHNQQGRRIALAEVNSMSHDMAKLTKKGTPEAVRKQFKTFVRTQTTYLDGRYNWGAIRQVGDG